MAIERTYFADKAPNELAENRSALSTPNTSSVAKCSRLTTSGQSIFPDRIPIKTFIEADLAIRMRDYLIRFAYRSVPPSCMISSLALPLLSVTKVI